MLSIAEKAYNCKYCIIKKIPYTVTLSKFKQYAH